MLHTAAFHGKRNSQLVSRLLQLGLDPHAMTKVRVAGAQAEGGAGGARED